MHCSAPRRFLKLSLAIKSRQRFQVASEVINSPATSSDDLLAAIGVNLEALGDGLHQFHVLLLRDDARRLIAPPKFGKSWLVYGLAIAVNTGRHWLDRFDTRPGRVLIIDNELHPATIAHRIPIVGDAMGIHYSDYSTGIDVWALRGNLRSLAELADDIEAIEPGYYKLIIYDAKYRFALDGVSENDNAAEARNYNLLDQFGAHTLAAQTVIHHSTKGGQGEKRVVDVGAGAGSQSRAADCHVVLREHEDDGLAVLDAAVRSFPPLEPVALRWEFPLWVPDEYADAGKLKGKLSAKDERQKDKDREGCLQIASALRQGEASQSVIRDRTGISKDRSDRLLRILISENQVEAREDVIRNNRTKIYSLVGESSTTEPTGRQPA